MFGRFVALHNYVRRGIEHRAASTKLKAFVDKLIWPASVFGIIVTIPQVWRIWFLHETAGISIISWSGYILTATVWLLYGLVYKLRPIIITNTIWVFLNSLIVVGAIIY